MAGGDDSPSRAALGPEAEMIMTGSEPGVAAGGQEPVLAQAGPLFTQEIALPAKSEGTERTREGEVDDGG